jgi:hypothetical protein
MRSRGIVAGTVAVAVGVASVALAAPVSVPNGGFEEGTFAKWERFERGGGNWQIYAVKPRGIGPIVPAPPEGDFAALLTQSNPGVNILHRVLKLKRDAVNKLKFQLFYENTYERFHSPKNFKFGGGGMVPLPRGGGGGDPNQQLRVDLMKPKAKIKSLRNKDILATLLWTKPGDPLEQPYEAIRANMTKLGIDSKRVRLRIAEVDNRGNFYVGVDDLKQTARPKD